MGVSTLKVNPMDLINQLSSQLGVDPAQAQALAGSVLGGVRGQVAEQMGEDAAGQLDAQVPELDGWQEQAEAAVGGDSAAGGLLGGLAGGLLGAAGGEEAKQAAQFAALLGNFGIDGTKAALIGPIALSFLKERMPAEWVQGALAIAPMLSGGSDAAGGGLAGAAMGALGGMFGGGE